MIGHPLAITALLAACWLQAAELSLDSPAARDSLIVVRSTVPGRWLVIGPGASPLTADAAELNRVPCIVAEDRQSCVWAGPPGSYAVLMVPDELDGIMGWLPVVVPSGPPGPGPGPGPGPDPPPGPEDEFGLGVKVAAWLAEIPEPHRGLAPQLAAAYTAAAERLESGEAVDIGDSNQQLLEELAAVLSSSPAVEAWQPLRANVRADLVGRELDRHELGRYYLAIAAGLGGD